MAFSMKLIALNSKCKRKFNPGFLQPGKAFCNTEITFQVFHFHGWFRLQWRHLHYYFQ
jgi:hypothetical protein